MMKREPYFKNPVDEKARKVGRVLYALTDPIYQSGRLIITSDGKTLSGYSEWTIAEAVIQETKDKYRVVFRYNPPLIFGRPTPYIWYPERLSYRRIYLMRTSGTGTSLKEAVSKAVWYGFKQYVSISTRIYDPELIVEEVLSQTEDVHYDPFYRYRNDGYERMLNHLVLQDENDWENLRVKLSTVLHTRIEREELRTNLHYYIQQYYTKVFHDDTNYSRSVFSDKTAIKKWDYLITTVRSELNEIMSKEFG